MRLHRAWPISILRCRRACNRLKRLFASCSSRDDKDLGVDFFDGIACFGTQWTCFGPQWNMESVCEFQANFGNFGLASRLRLVVRIASSATSIRSLSTSEGRVERCLHRLAMLWSPRGSSEFTQIH